MCSNNITIIVAEIIQKNNIEEKKRKRLKEKENEFMF